MLCKLGLLKSGNLMNWWMTVVWSQRAFQTRFSRDCKNVILEEKANHFRTGRPVVCSQRAHQFVIENDETESELSLGSRSFLDRVNDQVRKRQKQFSKGATQDSNEHSLIWWMVTSSTLQASVFMEKKYSDNLHSIKNTMEKFTLTMMVDISEQLILEQSDEIFGESNQLGKFSMETVISGQWWKSHQSLACNGLFILRFCSMSWKSAWEPNIKLILLWKKNGVGSRVHHNTEFWTNDGELISSGILSQDSVKGS